jgi:hypothetical protein
MRPFALLLLVLLSVSLPVQSLSAATHAEAQDLAARRVADVAEYGRANPDAPGAFAPWSEGDVSPGEPVLVHGYPDLEPLYYIVPLLDVGLVATSFITIDAATGAWQAYGALADEGECPRVGKESALAVAAGRLGRHLALSELLAVSMPNRGIYWRSESDGQEVFVNLWEEGDVRDGSDEELIAPRDLGRESHGEEPRVDEAGSPRETGSARYPTSYDITSVPHYYQGTSYHCGPAALEMVFDYWGVHVNQTDIGYVANTLSAHGTWTDDLRRAAHFSQTSTAALDPSLSGYDERWNGYAAAENRWSYPNTSDPDHVDRYNDLRELVSTDYPVLLLTWYDNSHNSGHFRVVKGYDDNTSIFIVHDPWYTGIYQGPDIHFNQTFLVDNLWTKFYRWGLFTAPWFYEYSHPSPIPRGLEFTLSIDVVYPGPHPFDGDYATGSPYVYLIESGGFQLAPGEMAQKLLPAITTTGTSGLASWQVIAPCRSTPATLGGHILGVVTGSSSHYASYNDQTGNDTSVTLASSQYPNYIYVDDSGGWDHLTIQPAIDEAPCDGDEVQVREGIYVGSSNKNLDFGGKNLKLKGIFGPGPTIIDCQNVGRGVYLHSGEDTTALISGFTIAAGNPSGTYTYGGGILCDGASAKFTNLVVTANQANYGGGMAWIDGSLVLDDVHVINNTATNYGGGLWCTRDTLGGRLKDVYVMDNSAEYSGGGMYNSYSENALYDVTFHNNSADFGGGMCLARSSPVVMRNHFQYNSAGMGSALFLQYESVADISRSNFVKNTSDPGKGAVHFMDSPSTLHNSIVAFNYGGKGVGGGVLPEFYHNVSYGNAEGDSLPGYHHENLFRDPYFCDLEYDDFTLADDSCCLPAFNPWGVSIGVYGAGDCGMSGVDDSIDLVSRLALRSPTPNPFGGEAAICYAVPVGDERLTVAVYSVSGRLVRVLHDGPAPSTTGSLVWFGDDTEGRTVASGVYFVRASFGDDEITRKLVVLR